MRDAAKDLGFTNMEMFRLCNTKKQVNGCIFKYADEEKYNKNYSDLDIKCPYCDVYFESYNGLCRHIQVSKIHGEISKEQFLTDYKYDGIRPLCACGCGKETDLGRSAGGVFNEYIKGHYSRIVNNWGHNKAALENSANTRRERFSDGTNIIWNKGKKWDETYTEEQISLIMKNYTNKNRNKKISDALSGVPKSEEHKEKVRITKNKPEAILKSREVMHDRIQNQTFSVSSGLEDRFAIDFLDKLNIPYKRQFYIKDIGQYCDFKILENNIVLECDGDFWHSNPRKYPEGPVYEYQKTKAIKDIIKNQWCEENGFKMFRFWEYDINKNPEMVLKILSEIEYNKNETTDQ